MLTGQTPFHLQNVIAVPAVFARNPPPAPWHCRARWSLPAGSKSSGAAGRGGRLMIAAAATVAVATAVVAFLTLGQPRRAPSAHMRLAPVTRRPTERCRRPTGTPMTTPASAPARLAAPPGRAHRRRAP
jgi:hypothetical protein